MPELKSKEYDYFVGRAVYIDDILNDEWNTIQQSFTATDSVLEFEKKLNNKFPQDQKYSHENKGSSLIKTYSEEYSTQYHDMLNGMVERRLTRSIIKVGSYWYTAWVNAGQPDLTLLMEKKPSQKLRDKELELDQHYNAGKIKGRAH